MSYNFGQNYNKDNTFGQKDATDNDGSGSKYPVSKGLQTDSYYRYTPGVSYQNYRTPASVTEQAPPKKESKGRKALGHIAALLAVGVISGAAGGGMVYGIMSRDAAVELEAPTTPTQIEVGPAPDAIPFPERHAVVPAPEMNAPLIGTGGSVADVVEAVSGSVVEISVMSVGMPWFGEMQFPSSGSGVIISQDGYIATNNHVIDGANEIKVRLSDGTEYEAVLVGADQETDLAVVKVDADGLTAVRLGDSDTLKVGETAIAIGNPLGTLGGTVTTGIVSALNREITIDSYMMSLIQTSAPVNSGNSGGGLFNEKGELIGIVNAKSGGTRGGTTVEGLGFAIPVNTVKKITGDIVEHGYVTGRPELGISILPILDNQTAFFARVTELGVYVREVTKENGLQIGDRIVSIEGTEVIDGSEIKAAIGEKKIGESLSMTIKRDGREITVNIPVTEKIPAYILRQRGSGNPF